MYHIVARRLGIHSVLTRRTTWEPTIIWKPNYNTNNLNNAEYFCVSDDSHLLYPSNIIRGRFQDNEFLLTSSNDIMIKVRSNAVEESLKRRTNDVKFAVGMIVTHIDKYSFILDNHDGVIIGWHRGYDIEIQNKFKETIMFPYLHQWDDFCHICLRQQFSASGHQLYYIILAENDIVCYVQQDQLSICPPKRINNIEIGRYFSSFKGTYYVPNESLRKHYPEDTAAIAKILAKQ
ncbi:F-box only protein 21-like isoform X1 [Formica exsecta]|uniref:F-box only protein 21-like isoform X1 n=1 Tax=Formica exsecta TaxID=72781 RepID=UPI0011436E46|nr:F-box only protein 21-like isoform X1 [Formica exsecta]